MTCPGRRVFVVVDQVGGHTLWLAVLYLKGSRYRDSVSVSVSTSVPVGTRHCPACSERSQLLVALAYAWLQCNAEQAQADRYAGTRPDLRSVHAAQFYAWLARDSLRRRPNSHLQYITYTPTSFSSRVVTCAACSSPRPASHTGHQCFSALASPLSSCDLSVSSIFSFSRWFRPVSTSMRTAHLENTLYIVPFASTTSCNTAHRHSDHSSHEGPGPEDPRMHSLSMTANAPCNIVLLTPCEHTETS